MGHGKAKGSSFEREICKTLSEWWSKTGSDDLFWRTQSSGARATHRKKVKKKTRGQYLDVCAVDSRGASLLKVCVISTKRGYPKVTLSDLMDRISDKESELELWIKECIEMAKDAKTLGWLLIIKRDRKETMILMPLSLAWRLRGEGSKIEKKHPNVIFHLIGKEVSKKKELKLRKKKGAMHYYQLNNCAVFGTTLKNFLRYTNRKQFVAIAKKWKKERKRA